MWGEVEEREEDGEWKRRRRVGEDEGEACVGCTSGTGRASSRTPPSRIRCCSSRYLRR